MGSLQNIENGTIRKRRADDYEGDSRNLIKPKKFAALLSMLETRLQASSNHAPSQSTDNDSKKADKQVSIQSYPTWGKFR
jgi:hypothetical protein